MDDEEKRGAIAGDIGSLLYAIAEAQHGLSSTNPHTYKEAARKIAVLTFDAGKRLVELTS